MAHSPTVDDLVLLWEERRAAGVAQTPGDLCGDHPELLAAFQARLQALESIDKMLDETVDHVRTLLRADLPKLFTESRAVCYVFQGPKDD